MKILDLDNIDYRYRHNLFYSYRWLRLLKSEYDFDFAVACRDDQGREPLLVFARIDDIFGKRIISLPFSDYTEPLVRDENELLTVLKLIWNEYNDYSLTFKYHGKIDFQHDFPMTVVRKAYCHRIPLAGDLEQIWRRTSKAFRKGVKKAQKEGLEVVIQNDDEGIEIFHKMLTNLRRKKFNILPQPISFYKGFLDFFIHAKQGNVWIVRHLGRPVAAALILHSGDMVFDKMGVSEQHALSSRPNNILLWQVMKYGHENNFEALDMGLTPSQNEGLLRFKDSLGGDRSGIEYYRVVPPNFNGDREQHLKKFLSELTATFVNPQVPDETVQAASRLLYRYFC